MKETNTQVIDDLFYIIGERLKSIRTELNISQKDLEKELNLKQNSITRIESGAGGTISTFIKIINFYNKKNYNIDWMVKENNDAEFRNVDKFRLFNLPKDQINTYLKNITENSEKLNKLFDEAGF